MVGGYKSKVEEISSQIGYATLEQPAQIKTQGSKLFIGIPKERSFQEKRVALTPQAVQLLTNNGHEVVIEATAGEESYFFDIDYSQAGAKVVPDLNEIYKAEIIIKVTPPLPDEIEMMRPDQLLITPIHLSTLGDVYVKSLMAKRITALAFEYIQDDSGAYPFVRSMSEIAGSTAILLAAEYLNNINQGKGILLGGISGVAPAKVLILGAGVVGEFAARTALGLGADVKIFDNSIYKLMRLQNHVGKKLFTSTVQPDILGEELKSTDVAIGAIHAKSGRTPVVVTEEMVAKMRPGSVIADVSIDQGGVFETSEVTTHDNPTFIKYEIIHYCVPNIPSRVSRTASYAVSNILTPTLLKASELGGPDKLIEMESGVRHGVYIYKGRLTNQHLSERFSIKYTDIDLLFASNL
ncbi:MAG: alanine dehydrogenase [Bacteroidetes bacterium]|nr:alanine dehydrogenase [Bacteroidota bacterium]